MQATRAGVARNPATCRRWRGEHAGLRQARLRLARATGTAARPEACVATADARFIACARAYGPSDRDAPAVK